MVSAILAEAEYAAGHFDVEVHVLILDSSTGHEFAEHADTVRSARQVPNVVVWHLGEMAQRRFLRQVVDRSGVDKPELILDLMLPPALSYGACTNRAFLIASALGCDSVLRRDSDARYQIRNGAPVFPIHHELMSLGKSAAAAAGGVSATLLDPTHTHQPVVLVGSSFVGELSVDISEIERLDPDTYYDIVSLWAPGEWSEAEKKALVDESFRGAGTELFTHDWSTLTVVDPMRVDMSNVGFHQVHEDVPLLPATDTIGSDYFLLHVVRSAGLPGVEHNRNIINFYTPERRTESGFVAYQTRLTKFFLSMLYLHFSYQKMAAAGASLLDDRGHVRATAISEIVRESAGLDNEENVRRLISLDRSYRTLGDKYAMFADVLLPQRSRLLAEARQDMEDFALLIDSWQPLIQASRTTTVERHPA